jgi:hypothetical protein
VQSARPLSKKVSVSAFFASALFHGFLLLAIGGYVISHGYVPKTPFVGEVLSEGQPVVQEEILLEPSVPAPPGPPSEFPDLAASQELPTPVSASASQLLTSDVISSPMGSAFAGAVGLPGASFGTGMSLGGGGAGGQGTEKGIGKMTTLFGSTEASSGTLTGVFYDLKQTSSRKPSGMTPVHYNEVIGEFLDKKWNETVLGDFYKLKQSIYASQFFIPLQRAEAAPAAFKAEKEVQPAMWVILYQGEFKAPHSGKFRFAGYADDVLLVRVNGKMVLDGSRASLGFDRDLKGFSDPSKQQENHPVGNGRLSYGSWMNLGAGQSNTIQVLLGERPGGHFCAFLLIEDKAENYKKEGNGRPILPLFQMAAVEMDFNAAIQAKTAPTFEAKGPIFGN